VLNAVLAQAKTLEFSRLETAVPELQFETARSALCQFSVLHRQQPDK
jgi:hypothetical protein